MKKLVTLMMLLAMVLFWTGCGSDDDGPSGPTPPTDAEVLGAGWIATEAGQWADAEAEFRTLLERGALLAEAHDGLGWVFGYQSAPDSAVVHFQAALDAGAADESIANQTQAGLAFALHAQGEHAACLVPAATVPTSWTFAHDAGIDGLDVALVRAAANYMLGQFQDSLDALILVDPAFTADVTTVDGRAALAARIEELMN